MTKSTITREQLRALAVKKIESLKFAITQSAFTNIRRGLEDELLLAKLALAAMDRNQVRQDHAEWSQATFGNVGPLKHLSKEALEAAEQPGDLSEWADMQFLLWDSQRRAGITDDQITQAMFDKLAVNKQREWTEPKDGEPRLHIKAQPAPIVPEEMTPQQASRSYGGEVRGFRDGWNACRAAMLQSGILTGEGTKQAEPVTTANKLGNSPLIPDGYVMVPKGSTEGMVIAGFESEPDEQ